jgi:hypothetical protein
MQPQSVREPLFVQVNSQTGGVVDTTTPVASWKCGQDETSAYTSNQDKLCESSEGEQHMNMPSASKPVIFSSHTLAQHVHTTPMQASASTRSASTRAMPRCGLCAHLPSRHAYCTLSAMPAHCWPWMHELAHCTSFCHLHDQGHTYAIYLLDHLLLSSLSLSIIHTTQTCPDITMTKAVVLNGNQNEQPSTSTTTLSTSQKFRYQIKVVRTGTAAGGPYTITDTLPTGFALDTATGNPSITGPVSSSSCSTSSLTVTCTFTFSGAGTATISIPAIASATTGNGIQNQVLLYKDSSSTGSPCSNAAVAVNVVRQCCS